MSAPAVARPSPLRRLAGALVLLALFGLGAEGAGRLAEREAWARLSREAASALPLAASALRAEIERQRAVPLVLAEEGTVRALLENPSPGAREAADRLLARIAAGTRASVVYIVARDGVAVAASNFDRPDSFVGNSYRFRQYFARAMAEGRAEQYALGTVSRRPGLYIAERVGPAAAPLGVVVAKLELDRVEAEWASSGRPIFASDARGIVLATSVSGWRFRTLRSLSDADLAAARLSLQFDAAPLTPIPIEPPPVPPAGEGSAGPVEARLTEAAPGAPAGRYLGLTAPVEEAPPGWRLTLLAPAGGALGAAAFAGRLVAALALLLLGALGLFLRRRRTREARRRAELARTNAILEARVAERTVELTETNRDLRRAMVERQAAEARTLRLRDDLAQANRLATLGQIAAGVAHEINQPLAAIRTYAENAGRFLDIGEGAEARANMGTVIGLTERIGAITETLRGLARRGTRRREAVALGEAVEGALLILASRIAESGVAVRRDPAAEAALLVEADRLGLEQVLVNLLRNAVEALEGRPAPEISIEARAEGALARLTLRDNGPGLSPEQRARLFTPFSTSKAAGLGLGLVISHDIVSELGGRLLAEETGPGAAFTIELPRLARDEDR